MKLVSVQMKKGFTLVELLVVIGILGILAAALVATIDPFEQLKKARDANTKNVLTEYLNGITRYYTNRNAFPWDPTASNGDNCNGGVAPTTASPENLTNVSDCTDTLITEKELRSSFENVGNTILDAVYVSYDSTDVEVRGCFMPQSKSGQSDKNTKFLDSGGVGEDPSAGGVCKANGGATNCWWCAK